MDAKMIGKKIAKARKELNLSQAQLAQRMFISPQAVGKWERGASMPDIITIGRLAELVNVDLNYFLENITSADGETTVKTDNEHAEQNDAEVLERSGMAGRPLLTNFSGSNLANTDFAGVTAHKSKFSGSALRGADFSGADLTGSTFTSCDMCETNFNGAILTDCTLSVADLTNAHFNKTTLVRTEFSKTMLTRAKFTDAEMVDVKLKMADLRKTVFEKCLFNGVDFEHCDFRGVCLDNQTFVGVRFDKAALDSVSFAGATLKNVSFRPSFALTNKYYKAIKTISFDGAKMDKLTYAALKGMGADLSKATTIL